MPKRKRYQQQIRRQLAAIEACIGEVEIEAADEEAKKPATFTATAYTGGTLRVGKYPLPVVVDLSGLTYANSITANLDHDQKQRVGHVLVPQNDGRSLVLSGVISASGTAAKEVVDSAVTGYPWQASIEALPLEPPEKVPAGKQVMVNGQTFTGPILVARKAKLFGFAFLSRGADESTSVSIAASAASTEDKDMNFEQWIEAAGFDASELTDQQTAHLRKSYDAELKNVGGNGTTEPIVASPKFDIDELKAAYAAHESTIETKMFAYNGRIEPHKLAEIKAEAHKDAITLKSQAIESEWSSLKFENKAIKAAAELEVTLLRAERPTGPAIHSSHRDTSPQVLEAALCMSRGVNDVEKQFKPEVLEAAHRDFRNMGLQQLLIMAASMNGYTCRPGERVGNSNLREVLQHAFPVSMIHASSTLNLSGILSNVANKELLSGYMEEDQTWREIAAIKSVSDFKQVTSYRMLDNMEYEELGAAGEIKHGKVSEESYTRQAKTYARMFALTRTDIINDDLGALDDLRMRVGAGAAKKFNNVFWSTFMDNSSFFTSGRGNYISGANTTLADTGLQLGVTAFRKLRSPSADGRKRVGNTIGGRPEILLVPPELEFSAARLYQSSTVNSGGAATTEIIPNANIHAGKYRPVVSDWLSDSEFTGYSSAAWYLFRNTRTMAPMVASFLNGMQSPTVESADADFNVLGVQFRGYHDFGCDQAEYLSGVKSKGEA